MKIEMACQREGLRVQVCLAICAEAKQARCAVASAGHLLSELERVLHKPIANSLSVSFEQVREEETRVRISPSFAPL